MHVIITAAEHRDGSIAYLAREQRFTSGQTVLTLIGEFDHEADAVLDGIVVRLTSGVEGDIVVDLSEVAFLNGHGLAAMLHLHRAACVRGQRLVLRCKAGTVCRSLGLVGLADTIEVVCPAAPVSARALQTVTEERREPDDRGPRRKRRPADQLSRRWHRGER